MVIAWLAESRGGGIRWGRRGVDGYGVGNVAGRKESALEDILAGSACYLDAAACQHTPEQRDLSSPTLIGGKLGLPRSHGLVQIGIGVNDVLVRCGASLEVRCRNLARNAVALVVRHGEPRVLFRLAGCTR